jgi:hypothetical protein
MPTIRGGEGRWSGRNLSAVRPQSYRAKAYSRERLPRSSRARYWILRAGTPRMKRLGGANSPLSHVSYTGSFKVHKRLVTPRAVTADSDTRPLNFK